MFAEDGSAPRVSVGMPVYNGAAFVEEAIESILAQDFLGFELIISDNGSTDETERICRSFEARDPRIRYVRASKNEGAAANYNRVFQLARGEYFKWAAHDDVCLPGFLSTCVAALDRSPATVLAYPRSLLIDENGAPCGVDTDVMRVEGTVFRRLRRCLATINRAAPVFGVIRTSALKRTRLIDSFISSDYVLIAELAILGNFVQLPEQLFLRRIHANSSRAANKTKQSVLAWFDPMGRPSWLPVRQRLMLEYIRSACRLIDPLGSRVLCVATIVCTVTTRRVLVLGGRLKRKMLGLLR